MAQVIVREGESLESAIRRFGRKVDDEKILKDYRDKQYFMKPSKVRRKAKKAALRKQELKNRRTNQMINNSDRK